MADPTYSPTDIDLLTRAVAAEAQDQPDDGQAAVAHVVLNRLAAGGYGGNTLGQIVMSGSSTPSPQFEPTGNPSSAFYSLRSTDPAYQHAAQIVQGVLSGDTPDPTNGATNFYAPKAQAALGRQPPTWAKGDPLATIGGHVFYAPKGTVDRGQVTAANRPPQADNVPNLGSPDLPALAYAPTAAPAAAPTGKPTTMASDAPAQSDADYLDALAPKPASATPLGVSFAPAATPSSDTAYLDALAPKAAPAVVAPDTKAAPASKATLTPSQVASGADPATGERVVGGKPFSSDASHFNNLLAFANGGLQGAGTDLMAATAALKAKLYDGNSLPLSDLYSQAKSTYEGGKAANAAANPISSALAETGGSLATALPAIALGGAGVAGAGNALMNSARAVPALASAVPAAEGVGSFLSGVAGAGKGLGNMLMRGGSLAANGAIQGATAGAISSGLSDQPIGDQVTQGAKLGAVGGVAFPVIGSAVGGLTNKLLGAASVSPETAQLAQAARDTYNIPIRAGQISESPGVRFLDSSLSRTPGMGYTAANAAQGSAFNTAVANTFGETADKITPQVMAAAKTRIGGVMNDVASKSSIVQDAPFIAGLKNVAQEAGSVLAPSEQKILGTQMQNVMSKFENGQPMTGEAYQALTRTGSPLDRVMNSNDSNLRHYAGQIKDTLDDALERSTPPDQLAALQQARSQYKAMKTIEPLVASSVDGSVSPAKLMTAVKSSYSNMAYGGGGQLGDLARIGQRFLKEPPSSGTAERLQSGSFINKLGNLGIAATGAGTVLPFAAPYASDAVVPALASMAAGYGAGRIASSVLRSPGAANRLINSSLGNPQVPGAVSNLVTGAAPAAVPLAYNRLMLAPPVPQNSIGGR